MGSPTTWDRWARQLDALSATGCPPEEALARIAKVVRADLEGRMTPTSWRGVGAVVRWARLGTSGASSWSEGRPVIVLEESERSERFRQRFTAAHEAAHLILARAQEGRFHELDYADEEALCDLFAAELLVAPEIGAAMASDHDLGPTDLLEKARTFGLGLQVALRVAARSRSDVPAVYLYAKWRGHPRRPDVVGFRVDTAGGDNRLYIPRHQRIASMGLTELAAWAEDAEIGDEDKGRCPRATFRTAAGQPPSKGYKATGPAEWRAVMLGAPAERMLLAVIDSSRLQFPRSFPGRWARGPRSVPGSDVQPPLWNA